MTLSEELEESLHLAYKRAESARHEFISPEHLLYALTFNPRAREVLTGCGVDVDALRSEVDEFLTENMPSYPDVDVTGTDFLFDPRYTNDAQSILNLAASHVHSAGKDQVDGGNVLIALFRAEESHAVYFLKKHGVTRYDLVRFVSHGTVKKSDNRPNFDFEGMSDFDDEEGPLLASDPLTAYCTDLVARAADGRIDPLIGRGPELERVVHILARRRKNNPVLVGDAGVGKTAIVEGLALRIHEGKVPECLKSARVYAVDMGAMLAGTRYRGDFEERMTAVIEAATEDRENRILFFDEIHNVIGAGGVSGSAMDASNMLKPVLANGDLRCIGTTTFKEYRQVFEKDHALARRFQRIEVGEPTLAETVDILKGLQPRYEEYHGVSYSGGAIKTAAELASRYINDRFLPDKAIDVIDEAAAGVKLRKSAAADSGEGPRRVTTREIESTISRIAKVPAKTVSLDDRKRLETMERDLKLLIYGQDDAVGAVSRAIRMSRAGLNEPGRPIGSFLFAGPTGVGKTELARSLASVLGIEFLRFDMSEYMEKHSVSRLIGSPPGYVGFDQGGQLTEAVHRTPHAVVLLDELEKAHEDIFNILLQVMDYATLTDNNGRKTDFRQVILIMTTNTGAREAQNRPIGFEQKPDFADRSMKAIERTFTPEFRNRLSAIVQFNSLPIQIAEQIVDKMVSELEGRLKAKGVSVSLTSEARRFLAKTGFDEKYGARPLRRLIENKIAEPLSEALLFGDLGKGGEVSIGLKGGELSFSY